MARILLGNAGLALLFHPSVIILFFIRAPVTGPGFCYTLLTSLWLFHPPGIITFMSMAPYSFCLLLASLLLLNPFGIISFSYSRAGVLLGVAVLLLTIPSTRNHLFLVYGPKIMLVIAGLPSSLDIKKKNRQLEFARGCRDCVILSVLGQEEGCTVKFTPSPEGVPEGKTQGISWRQRGIFDRISQLES